MSQQPGMIKPCIIFLNTGILPVANDLSDSGIEKSFLTLEIICAFSKLMANVQNGMISDLFFGIVQDRGVLTLEGNFLITSKVNLLLKAKMQHHKWS